METSSHPRTSVQVLVHSCSSSALSASYLDVVSTIKTTGSLRCNPGDALVMLHLRRSRLWWVGHLVCTLYVASFLAYLFVLTMLGSNGISSCKKRHSRTAGLSPWRSVEEVCIDRLNACQMGLCAHVSCLHLSTRTQLQSGQMRKVRTVTLTYRSLSHLGNQTKKMYK